MRITIAITAICLSSLIALAQSPQAWDAKNIVWQDIAPDGTKYALLEGDRNQPGKAFTTPSSSLRDIGSTIGIAPTPALP